MAVSIDLTLTQISQNSSAKTSVVGVSVTASWTGGSYNATSPGPALTIYIDGVLFDSCNVGFNTSQTNNGSTQIYYSEVEVEHNSDGTKTLHMSASYATGTGSGTVADSASLILTPFEASSGGSSGGSTGGDLGGGSSTTYYKVNILPYPHAHVTVRRNDTNEALTKGSSVPAYTEIIVEVSADAGYEISTVTQNCINLGISNGSASFFLQKDTTIAVGAAPVEGSYRHPVKVNNCALVGRLQGYYSHGYSENEWREPSGNIGSVGYDGAYGSYYVEMLTITTPALDDISDVIHFEVDYTGLFYTGSTATIMYALCKSDANKNYYKTATAAVYDENQLGVGTATALNSDVVDYQLTHSILSFDIPTTGLQPDTTYYLLLWRSGSDAINDYNVETIGLYYDTYCSITVDSPIQGVVPIVDGAIFQPHRICIDNGADFDYYAAYIDNGTSFEPI